MYLNDTIVYIQKKDDGKMIIYSYGSPEILKLTYETRVGLHTNYMGNNIWSLHLQNIQEQPGEDIFIQIEHNIYCTQNKSVKNDIHWKIKFVAQ